MDPRLRGDDVRSGVSSSRWDGSPTFARMTMGKSVVLDYAQALMFETIKSNITSRCKPNPNVIPAKAGIHRDDSFDRNL